MRTVFAKWMPLAIVLCALASPPAQADVRIFGSPGGEVGPFLDLFKRIRDSGERVVIDGPCLSACTLVLGVIPRERICATERARFGFHAAWMPDSEGRPVTSPMGTQALWRIYPASVRQWISRHGGLSRKMIYLEGRALSGIVPSCAGERRDQARSERRYAPRPVRYERANAASYRRY